MALPNQTGKKVPDATFKIRDDYQWITKSTQDIFANRRVVVFALPGAFTPTCSSVHLPRYNDLYDSVRAAGVDEVICLAVNDSFVMNEWKRFEKADKIFMLPDGNGEFSSALGLLVDKKDLCFGQRSWRYSMVVDDGVIEQMFIEPEQDGDPFGESSAENMLKYLNPQATVPDSITVFTKRGCQFCAKAKELLRKNKLPFEELVLSEDFTIKTVLALSNTTKVPQVFINGKHIGGSDKLEVYLSETGGTHTGP
jgi:glutaredoxin-like protein